MKPSHEDFPTFALSVRQPWAWAIIHGGKHLENRSRGAMKHLLGRHKRGRIAVHASKGMTRDEYEGAIDVFKDAGLKEWPRPDELVRGAIIGTVDVLGVLGPDGSTSAWWMGGPALRLADPQPIEPWPLSGALGYFTWDEIERHLPELEKPLPWMVAWPEQAKPQRKPAPGLFD